MTKGRAVLTSAAVTEGWTDLRGRSPAQRDPGQFRSEPRFLVWGIGSRALPKRPVGLRLGLLGRRCCRPLEVCFHGRQCCFVTLSGQPQKILGTSPSCFLRRLFRSRTASSAGDGCIGVGGRPPRKRCPNHSTSASTTTSLKSKTMGSEWSMLMRDLSMAERVGFEPTVPCGTHAFQACALSHSAISPGL
jgi:hypothetical protein